MLKVKYLHALRSWLLYYTVINTADTSHEAKNAYNWSYEDNEELSPKIFMFAIGFLNDKVMYI